VVALVVLAVFAYWLRAWIDVVAHNVLLHVLWNGWMPCCPYGLQHDCLSSAWDDHIECNRFSHIFLVFFVLSCGIATTHHPPEPVAGNPSLA
jgi:hypothetical protein